ncbi:MAG TPA: leucine--tRNA ligase [Candidatus Paceibacterota bacterium]
MAQKKYDHSKIEKKWQKEWQSKKTYKTSEASDKPKFYVLDMFPYPSGEGLHVGHPKGYIATDIVSRMKRMQGFNVLHPMGFDAFGLPAENYAIKTKTNPSVAVAKNVARYKKQLEILGFDYDWSREVNTTDPKFYKWTQWIFLKLLEKGLAYESYEPINWCPSCKTGLANEDVEDGKCERCGTPVEKKKMRQWVLRITDYADRLLADLDQLEWPESIKESQRNWIGRSEGAEIGFALKVAGKNSPEKLTVFTTRPDTLFGVTYVVVAPEHSFVTNLIADLKTLKNRDEVIKYVAHARMMTEIERTDAKKDKTGVRLDGVFAINPANNEEVPVYVADYVLAEYGTGAVMAVPAHDERDMEFATKYKLPVKPVVEALFAKKDGLDAVRADKPFVERTAVMCLIKHWSEDKYLCSKWRTNDWQGFVTGGIDGNESEAVTAEREVAEETGYINAKYVKTLGRVNSQFYHDAKKENRLGHFVVVELHLKDGAQKETAAEEKNLHEIVWVPREKVRDFVNRPDLKVAWDMLSPNFCMTDEGILINSEKFDGQKSVDAKKKITEAVGGRWVVKYKLKDWVFSRQRYWGEPFPIMKDGDTNIPVAEKDLPVELPKVKSYEPTGTGESPLADISKWVNVKVGSGKSAKILRRETNTMPQWAGSSWYYLRFMDPQNSKAIVGKDQEKYWSQVDFYVGGAEHATRHLIYARFWHKFLYDIGAVSTLEPFKKLQSVGLIMGEDGRKMSKRFGNVVNPDEIVASYGADTMRVYEMFMGPFDQAIAWNTNGMIGTRRFLERVWKLSEKVAAKPAKNAPEAKLSPETETLLHKTIKKVSEDMSVLRHNTAVSSLMILSNAFEKEAAISRADFESFLKLLAPLAPHITEELWQGLGNKKSIHVSEWPVADEAKLKDAMATIVVQVNGKVRASFSAAPDASKESLEKAALALDDVRKWVGDKKPDKIIVVPGKLVSFVIKQ